MRGRVSAVHASALSCGIKKVKGHQVRVHSLIKYGLLSNCPQLRSDEHTSAFSVIVFGYKGGCG